MRAALVTMIVAACCGALAPGAAAEWTEPAPLSDVVDLAWVPRLAYDGAGNGTAAWLQGVPAQAPRIMTADRPAGEGWQEPVKLSLDTRPAGTNGAGDRGRMAEGGVELAVNARGDAVVVWAERDVNGSAGAWNARIRARLRPAGGTWGPTRDVSGVVQTTLNVSDLALTDDGEALAAWTVPVNGTTTELHAARLAPGASDWDAPDVLAAGAGERASAARLAFAPDGAALVAWTHAAGGTTVVRTRTRSTGGAWGAPADVPSPGTSAGTPAIAVDADGDGTVAFTESNGTHRVVRASRRAAGASTWSASEQVSAAGGNAEFVDLVMEPGGDALAAWSRDNGTDVVAQAARHPAGSGSWQSPDDLSAAGLDTRNLALVLDEQGTATATWMAYAGGVGTLQAARRTPAPDRDWEPARDLATELDEYGVPAVAAAPGGNATVTALSLGRTLLSTVDFDAATPSLSDLVAPVTGIAGTQLSFSVQASGATGVTWDFGDGTTATGTSATHAFAAAGSYTVTVRATDGFGAPATASATVSVSPLTGDPGPGGGDPGPAGGGGGGGGATPGGATTTTPTPPVPPRLRVQLAAPAQRLATVAERRSLALTCTLPIAGRCTVRVTVDAATARALGLKVAKGAKRVTVGTVRSAAKANRKTTLRLRLSKAVARRLAKRRSVAFAVRAEGVAGDGWRAAATATLTVRR